MPYVILLYVLECFVIIFQTSEKEMLEKEKGADKAVGASESVIFKVEVPANRCVY